MIQKKLYFDEVKHQYTYGATPKQGEIFISVTTLIGLFKEKFDSNYWSLYKALQRCLRIEEKKDFSSMLRRRWDFDFDAKDVSNIEYVSVNNDVSLEELYSMQNVILGEWKVTNLTATTKGTGFHNFKENKQYEDNGTENEGVFTKLIEELPDNLEELHHPLYTISIPELRLFNEEFGIAGTADESFIFPSKFFDINDWKTNKKIDVSNKYQKMKGPLKHLDDCSFNHYCLQISTYAWMLEQFGYKPRKLKFTHVKIDDNNNVVSETPYYTHYMKTEVENMLNYYRDNKKDLLNER